MTNAESKYRPVCDTAKTPDAESNPNLSIFKILSILNKKSSKNLKHQQTLDRKSDPVTCNSVFQRVKGVFIIYV